jgi:predicted deacetylase
MSKSKKAVKAVSPATAKALEALDKACQKYGADAAETIRAAARIIRESAEFYERQAKNR